MLASEIWRDYVTDGVPASGRWNPPKSDIRGWAADLEGVSGRALVYPSSGAQVYNAGNRKISSLTGLTIGSGTEFGDISVLRTRTTMDWHGFEDWGTLNVSAGAALGYASFDAKPTLTTSVAQDHFVGFQARNILTGAGNVTGYIDGFNALLTYNGSGIVSNTHFFRARIPTVGGSQVITNMYGFYAEDFSASAINSYGFFSAHPNNRFNALQVTNALYAGIAKFGKTVATYTTDGMYFDTSGGNVSATSTTVFAMNRNGSDGAMMGFYKAGVAVGSISVTGSATTYATSSDYRRKPVQEELDGFWERIDKIIPRRFQWDTGEWANGFIAHEFAEAYPGSVTGEKDAVDEDGEPIYQSMQASTSEVMADVIAALQDLRRRITIH